MQLLTYSRTTEQKLKDSYKTLKDVDNVIKQTTSQGEKLKKKTLKDFKENKKIIDDDKNILYIVKPFNYFTLAITDNPEGEYKNGRRYCYGNTK